MKKIVTISELSKIIKGLEDKRTTVLAHEEKASIFNCASEENADDIRPDYDFDSTQSKLEKIERSIVNLKHALNIFNTTTIVGDTGLTIDQILVALPQLNKAKSKLQLMSSRMPRDRVNGRFSSPNYIDYELTNYDVEEAEKLFEKTSSKLALYQTQLDQVNINSTIEIDID